ncbi:hypothetical protein DFP72DRAFT_883531 [Ephemerocybe angulata]|uniref:Arrestin C-terminal-like domain-containing protein n=1 Tax=Ephemerocybe angulata TaxID=980116 RepID=A0A8H6I9E5_9AGAR|nr:hypothetical protein DFP72DRAFT_883531 [Tulosesus angulatus]
MTGSPSDKHPKKSALSIRLTESAVFLRTDGPSGRPHRNAETRNSLVRGLLVLELAKPTKIESVELELIATAATAWPDGVGARRVEVSEQHEVFHASTVYFRADKLAPTTRRAASIGPGTLLADDPTLDWDLDDLDDPAQSPTHLNEANGPVALTHSNSANTQSPNILDQVQLESLRVAPGPRAPRVGRQVSVDSHYFQRTPVSHQVREEEVPIPPYSPIDPSPSAPPSRASSIYGTIEQRGAELQSSMQNYQQSPSGASTPSLRHPERSLSRRPSMEDVPEDYQLEHNPPAPGQRPSMSRPRLTRSITPAHSRSGSTSTPSLASEERPAYISSDPNHVASPTENAPTSPTPSGPRQSSTSIERRGRNRSRFSFTAVADAFREAVRSTSPMTQRLTRASKERGDSPREREQSTDDQSLRGRGRTMERSVAFDEAPASSSNPQRALWEPTVFALPNHHRTTPRNMEPFAGLFAGGPAEVKEKKELGNGWKEFKRGTYTYPISFSIPSTAPASLHADFGSVTWKLYAHVHRPGAFKSKYTATREVQVIACPTEEDTEDTENIIVERHWDQQLQYLISVSGRSFHIGGVMPVSFAFMPLAKVKIHRLSMLIEERVDYYNNMRRIVRTDHLSRFPLLSIKNDGKHPEAILPLESNDVEALRKSPLYPLINQEDDEGEVASMLMGPGPWSFHHDLKLPTSCDQMHFTNKNRRANITVSHVLKVVIRVERGDDEFLDKSGKRKLFDIVVQTPVHILSCRCNPDWVSLPRYEETFNSRTDYVIPNCPCQFRKLVARSGTSTPVLGAAPKHSELHLGVLHSHIPAPIERMISHTSTGSPTDEAGHRHRPLGHHSDLHHHDSHTGEQIQAVHLSETSPIDPAIMQSLRLVAERNPQNAQMLRGSLQFSRLVAGFESEFGEAPPTYDAAVLASPGSGPPTNSRTNSSSSAPAIIVN